jgi:hypothetical protein
MQQATIRITTTTYNITFGRCTRGGFVASIVQSLFSGRRAPKLTHHRSLASYHRMGKKKSGTSITEDKYHLPAHASLNDGKGKIARFLAVYSTDGSDETELD